MAGKQGAAEAIAETPLEPITLYFDLQDGFTADLEVISRVSLAWAAAIKEAAYMIDPLLEVRVEVSDATSGSFSLNGILRNLHITKDGETLTLRALAFVVVAWMSTHAMDYAFEKGADIVTGHEQDAFTPEQKRELREIVEKAMADKAGAQRVQQVYREAERDPAIKGMGATQKRGERPAYIVPRSEFRARSGRGGANVLEETINRRTTVEEVRVMLISPVLLPGTRRWRVQSSVGEFGVTIKDQDFLNQVLMGTTHLRMRGGIEMVVELETHEEFRNGVWETTDRNVLKVERLIEPPTQGDLPFAPTTKDDQSDDDGH
jgi:hypothetical protein